MEDSRIVLTMSILSVSYLWTNLDSRKAFSTHNSYGIWNSYATQWDKQRANSGFMLAWQSIHHSVMYFTTGSRFHRIFTIAFGRLF